MLFVRVVSFEQIYFVRDTLPDPLFVKPTGKISVILPALCYGEIGTYWREVFQPEHSGQYLFLHLKSFVRGQPTEACWSHLHLAVQGGPCWDVRGAGIYHLQHQIPSRDFTGASACQEPVMRKVKNHLSPTDSPSLMIPVFLSIPGFSMYFLHLHMMTVECFFSFLNGNKVPTEDLHCGMSLISGLQTCLFPLKHSAMGKCY